jgi:serine/threonine protein kinase
MLQIGQVIKDLWRVEAIKHGGMGVIYICRRIPGGGARHQAGVPNPVNEDADGSAPGAFDTVVFKSVSGDFYASGDNRLSFDREALIWSTLPSHPYVVACKSVDRIESAPLIMLEYAAAGSLRDRMSSAPLGLTTALRIFRQVCIAMQFIEECGGIRHRDLKPENILLTAAGDAKITDFGLASLQRYGIRALLGTEPGHVHLADSAAPFWGGTLPYMSPEHFGTSTFTAASDVYSFGAVMFEVIEGRHVFEGTSVEDYRRQHLGGRVPPLDRSVPRRLAAIIATCLEKNPARRFQNFRDVDRRLAALIEHEGLDVAEPLDPSVEELEDAMTGNDWLNRGYGFAQLGHHPESMVCYQRAVALNPEDLGSNINVATALSRVGRTDEAMVYYRLAVQLHPDVPFAHFALASALAGTGRLDEAVTQYRLAIAGEANIACMRELVQTYRMLGREDECEEIVQLMIRTLSADPVRYSDANWVNEGLHLGLLGAFGISLRFFDMCLDRYPSSIDGWYNRAVTLLFLGEVEKAIASAERALALRSDLPQARFLLGLLWLLAGDGERAGVEWRVLQRNHPDHRYATRSAELARYVIHTSVSDMIRATLTENAPAELYYR